ncbi:MAG TPA: helix-turn-helix domain-containing protein [Planctomycetota bacterium]|nr:helix-turn-helix domain-containing protein [Planctomycetota bacterium]
MAKTAEFPLSERIRSRMKALNLSYADVASACNVTEVSVRNWTKDANRMASMYLRPLADVLKCSIDYLCGATDRIGKPDARATA